MEELGKKRLVAAAAVAVGIVYFFVCALPLRKDLALKPVWAREIPQVPQAAAVAAAAEPAAEAIAAKPAALAAAKPPAAGAARAHPFLLSGRFGYFEPDGKLLFSAAAPYGVALSPEAFATYERLSTGFSIRSPEGVELARSTLPGYPFFDAGRRFVLAPDQCGIAELGPSGQAIWHRH